jgi:hypothetical protein
MVIIEFAQKYGLKEGILLTELCRRMFVSESMVIPFSVSQGQLFFPYMSVKQLRLALQNLKRTGAITPVKEDTPTFDRTRRYQIQTAPYQYYVQTVMAQQFPLGGQ